MEPRRYGSLFLTFLLILCFYTIQTISPTVSRAESIQLFATIAADPDDFQLELSGPAQPGPYGPESILTFTVNYGSYLTHQTDVIVIQVSWNNEQLSNGQATGLLEYVENSATSGLNGATPVVDIQNRSITWQISPVPPGTDHQVSWQLQLKNVQLANGIGFSIHSTLIGPGIEKPASPLNYTYSFLSPIVTPTPSPSLQPTPASTTPTITPSGQQGPSVVSPTPHPPGNTPGIITKLLESITPLLDNIAEFTDSVAEGGGVIVAAPIPLLLILIPAIAQVVTLISQIPWWQILPLLTALFWSRPKRPWGVVYDSVTKQPIDPAIITLIKPTGEKKVVLSDFYGRYQFLVDPGTYELTAKKVHYQFPSQQLKGQDYDGVYSHLYFGGKFTIREEDAITYNIPLDPISPDWNQLQKNKHDYSQAWHKISVWLFRVGFVWSIVMFSASITILNGIVLAMYIVLIILRWLQKLRSPWGVVYDQQGKPIIGAAVSIIDLDNPEVTRPPVITGNSGRYVFLVEKGRYQLQVAVKSDNKYLTPSPGPEIEVDKRQGHIAVDLTVSTSEKSV